VLGARNRQRARLRSGCDHNVLGFQQAVADAHSIRRDKGTAPLDHLDLAARHRASEVAGNVLDHVLFAINQRGPVEPRLADADMVDRGAVDVVQCLTGGDQNLLRCTTAVRAGAPEVARLDHRNRKASAPDRAGHTDAGIASTQDHDVECLAAHEGCRYLLVMVDVIELTTMVAILNCASRFLMLCRLAIQSKSVHTAQTSPLLS
jgi:hypothetical protein